MRKPGGFLWEKIRKPRGNHKIPMGKDVETNGKPFLWGKMWEPMENHRIPKRKDVDTKGT